MNFYTAEQLAEMLKVTPEHVRRKIRDGIIPTVPDDVCGTPRIPASVVEQWDKAWMLGGETFGERRMRMEIEEVKAENERLRKTLVSITQLGMEGMK